MKPALPTGRRLLLTGIAAAALVAGGGAAAFAAAPGDEPSPSSTGTSAPDARVEIDQAMTAALQKAPGRVAEADLDDEGGRAVWEIEVLAGDGTLHEVAVDGFDGKVLTDRTGRDEDQDEDRERDETTVLKGAKTTAQQAVSAALQAAPGAAVSVELDDEGGRATWEIEVKGRDGKVRDLSVDAASGKVVKNTVDDEQDDEREDGDD